MEEDYQERLKDEEFYNIAKRLEGKEVKVTTICHNTVVSKKRYVIDKLFVCNGDRIANRPCVPMMMYEKADENKEHAEEVCLTESDTRELVGYSCVVFNQPFTSTIFEMGDRLENRDDRHYLQ